MNDSEITNEVLVGIEDTKETYADFDVIGAIDDTLGFHVNSPWYVAAWETYKVSPSTPRRLFAGVETYCYCFENKDMFVELFKTTDLSRPEAVPQSVTRRQARQALLLAGLLDKIPLAINDIEDSVQRGMVKIEWEDSLTFERNRASLITLSDALGMSSKDLDNLFISASKL